MDFGTLLEHNAMQNPHKTAVVSGTVRQNYESLNKRINQLANAMLAHGVASGQKVGIVCQNSHEYVETVFACIKIGAISVHINWRWNAIEIKQVLTDNTIGYVFFSTEFMDTFSQLRQTLPDTTKVVSIGGVMEEALEYEWFLSAGAETTPQVERPADSDIAMEFFTSGTTDRPKGVLLTHKSMFCHAMTNMLEAEWTEETVYLFSTPLFHAAATGAYIALLMGGTLVLCTGVQFPQFINTIQSERVTRIAMVPVLLKRLLEYPELERHDLSSLDTIAYSSAPMPEALIKEAICRFQCRFVQTYGMTEMGPVICILGSKDHTDAERDGDRRLLSVGRPVRSVRLQILDDDGKRCAPEELGEIVVQGSGMMRGYDNLPDATTAAIRDGWYYTGDMGYLDAHGYVYLVERKADMIISGGENIYSKEIENCIGLLDDDIENVAVIGVPDEEWGEIVLAVVIPKQGSAITKQDIITHCKQKIASYKKPRRVEFVQELPLNANGKVVKNVLRQQYTQKNTIN